jgi:hypothetical protein
MMWRLAFVLTMILASCSSETSESDCGESFCLPYDAQLVSKRTPVEDFNLYQVEWNGRRFVIYEGNAPNETEIVATTLPLPLDPEARLRRDEGHGSVTLRMHPQWPNYLQINGSCVQGEECAAATLARSIRRR